MSKDPFKVWTKTLCHHDFTAVDPRQPCDRAVCVCNNSYSRSLELSRQRRREHKVKTSENA